MIEFKLWDALIDPVNKEIALFITDISEEWLIENEAYILVQNMGMLIYRQIE